MSLKMTATIDGCRIAYRPGDRAHVTRILRAASMEGTIQADQMGHLFPGQPTAHTTMSLDRALGLIGAELLDP